MKICYYSHALTDLRVENDQHIPSFNEVKNRVGIIEGVLNNNDLFKDIDLTIVYPKEKENSILEKAKILQGIFGNNIYIFQKC